MLAWYRTLIGLRRDLPELADPRLDRVFVSYDESEQWLVVHRGRYRVVVNLAEASQLVPLDRPIADTVVSSGRSYPAPAGLELDADTVAIVEVE
jgi:maltooligosyltrehalose trehalohydrolase